MTKALNFKFDDSMISDIEKLTETYHITKTEFLKEAISEFIEKLKKDPYYKLTANVKAASEEETEEILEEIDNMTDDDLSISSSKRFNV
jgi:predicted transcriptional regulator